MRLTSPRLVVAAAAASMLTAGVLATASPASASGCSTGTGTGGSGTSTCDAPVSVSVTVPSTSETLTLSTTTLSFGTVAPGSSATATETWSVSGNDSNGFELDIQAGGSAMQGSSNPSDTLPNSALSVSNPYISSPTCNPTGADGPLGSGRIIDWAQGNGAACEPTPSGAGNNSATDTWTINVPAGQAGDSYSESFDYVLTAK